jgi:hypothetical protein
MASLPSGTSIWTEPESAANTSNPPQYPYNNVTQTKSGHTFEMDDTQGRERIRIQHRANTFIEMHPNGDEVHKIYGDGYEIVMQNKNVLITGTCNITINGNANFEVLGDKNEKIHGNYNLEVLGDSIQRFRGTNGIEVIGDKKVSISSDRDYGGTMSFSSGSHITVNSDLDVKGGLTARIITSDTRVDALTGMYAGPLGINTIGSLKAPIAYLGIMNSIMMSDLINSVRYDAHIHPAPHGVTGLPTLLFIPPVPSPV